MKKIIYILAAMVAIAACSKENPAEESGTDTTTNKGRMVTISVSAPETKVVGTDNGESFSFKWEEGDKILVKDNYGCADPQVFTLVTGAGTKYATFTGILPELLDVSDSYVIQYPVSNPDLNSQTYKEGKIASGLMQFYKSGLDKDNISNVDLEPNYAILQINLYGLARSVKTIEVRNVESSTVESTLICSTPVTVGKDSANATPFYIVYNGGSNVQLQIDVDMNEEIPDASDLADYESYGKGTPISCKTFVQSETAKQIISNGTCVNMPAVSLTTIWAPVNCGYDPDNFKYGKLYQWGRKDGSGYIDGKSQYNDAGGIVQNTPDTLVASQINAEEENPLLYYNTTYVDINEKGDSVSVNTDWFKTPDNTRWDATGGSYAVHFAKKGVHDPCPEGWRVPTNTEMATLMGGNKSTGEFPISTHGSTTGIAGRWFDGSTDPEEDSPTSGVFLPVVGYRNSLNTAACSYRQTVSATYWTSSVSGGRACSLGFGSSTKPSISTNSNRAGGYAVRCVQE